MFIMIDGIDGSGKSTIMNAWTEQLISEGKSVFNIKDYWNKHHSHPQAEELQTYDVIISAEPTTVWVGAAIRQEIIANDTNYSALATAAAYSLDRHILYTRLLIPLLQAGKIVIQDRGVSTSLCYQPIQDSDLSVERVASLEGNALALDHRPDHLIIADVDVEKALDRLGGRHEKKDDAQFEKKEFLEKAKQSFLSETFQKNFLSRGTQVHTLNTDENIDIMKTKAIELLSDIFKS